MDIYTSLNKIKLPKIKIDDIVLITLLEPEDSLKILNQYDYNKINLNKVKISDDIEDIKHQYKKPWIKLDKFQKINRLMEYVKRLKISKEEEINLKNLLIDNINEKKITKKTDIEYDELNGLIIEIKNLYKNINNIYYINKDITMLDVVKTEICSKPVATFKKLNISNILNKKTPM